MEAPKESKTMAEIREIREKLSEEMAGMTPEERVAHTKRAQLNF